MMVPMDIRLVNSEKASHPNLFDDFHILADVCPADCLSELDKNRSASRAPEPNQSQTTLGKSGHIKSHRSYIPCASRFGQSPLSCSFHFIRLALRPYFSISLRTL